MKIEKNKKFILLVGILCFVFGAIFTYVFLSYSQQTSIIPINNQDYFSYVHETLKSAKKSIHIIMFEMRYYYPEYNDSNVHSLLNDLIDAKNRNVDVKVILEGGEDFLGADFLEKQKEACSFLQNSGIEVKFDRENINTHAKLVIVDSNTVILGSTNWNFYALEKNNEASALIKSNSFANSYENYFQNLWKISKAANCEIFPEKNCSSIEGILANKFFCDKKNVEVSGIIKNLKIKISKAGNIYSTFDLISTLDKKKKLNVFKFGNMSSFFSDGAQVAVKGTYKKEKIVSGYTYYDEIEAEEVKKYE